MCNCVPVCSYSQAVVLSVTDETGVSYVIDILLESCRSKESVTRQGLLKLVSASTMLPNLGF